MIEVNVSRDGVEDDEPPSCEWLQEVVEQTLGTAKVEDSCEVSILLTEDGKMRELNRQYRGKDKPTDVLSFAFEEDGFVQLPPGMPRILGDVVLSLETIKRQATENSRTFPQETAWALCHGVLHLLGYDHQTDEEEAYMRAAERAVLESLGEEFLVW